MLPDKEGMEGLQELIKDYPSLPIIIISAHIDKAYIQTINGLWRKRLYS